jgi:hypothetical protein
MNTLIKFLYISIISILPLQAVTVDEILTAFTRTLDVPTIQGKFKVSLISQNGDRREIEARVYQKKEGEVQNNRLFLFDFPPTVRGTGLLLHSYTDGRENNMWIYLPTIRRIKRIALENSGGGYFMGSDFTYKDLIGSDYNKLDFKREADATLNGHDCYVIRGWGQTRQIQQENGYSFMISYHRKDNFLLIKRDFYDLDQELLKVYQIEDFLQLEDNIYPTKITMHNVQNGHKSIIAVTEISTDEIPDRFFTTRYLQNN